LTYDSVGMLTEEKFLRSGQEHEDGHLVVGTQQQTTLP
jgi:hypothetical protein